LPLFKFQSPVVISADLDYHSDCVQIISFRLLQLKNTEQDGNILELIFGNGRSEYSWHFLWPAVIARFIRLIIVEHAQKLLSLKALLTPKNAPNVAQPPGNVLDLVNLCCELSVQMQADNPCRRYNNAGNDSDVDAIDQRRRAI